MIIAAVGGLIGAKIFNALETWDSFIRDPIGSLFSRSGLTFYGGLIVVTAVLYYYTKKHKFSFAHLCDAAAPALMISYAIGRLGCQLAGDGDWGIYNSAYITQHDGSLTEANPSQYHKALIQYTTLLRNPSDMDTQAIYALAPDWAPRWLWAQNYPRNVGEVGIPLESCPTKEYCTVLPVSVFPTPVYEFIICTLLFVLLWAVRRKLKGSYQMFGLYLLLSGAERFMIEKIRVNYKYNWGFVSLTQAEIIATGLILLGLSLLYYSSKRSSDEGRPAIID
jgi:phosphatidylglycerol:prolipoprotein diacylglycerol transferase